MVQAVVGGLGNRAAVGYACAFQLEPHVQFLPQGPGTLLAYLRALLASQRPGHYLNPVQPSDALDRLRSDRAGVGLEEFVSGL